MTIEFQIDSPTSARISGSLTIQDMEEARRALDSFALTQTGEATLDASGLKTLDTVGALLLKQVHDDAARAGRTLNVVGLASQYHALFELIADADLSPPPAKPKPPLGMQLLCRLGKGTVQAWNATIEILEFFGQSCVLLARGLRHPKHLRIGEIIRHIDEIGVNALPIVCLIAFMISVVLAYQGSGQLKRFGAEQFTADLMGISVLREMGVLLTAIMVAGRSGSAFAAEIGVMKVREEVDALQVTGIDPFEMLVMPRLMALIIALPILTLIANIMGLLGGGVVASLMLDLSFDQYFTRIANFAKGKDFFVGMIKAPVFAFLIAVVGCMHGMKVSGSAESVGKHTTSSVVHSIFLVMAADALFAVMFSKLGL